MIGRNGERRSGISAQAARHDDDDSKFPLHLSDKSQTEKLSSSFFQLCGCYALKQLM